jgi:hypothetical protein
MKLNSPRIKAVDLIPLMMVYWSLVAPASLLHHLGIKGLYSTVFIACLAIVFAALTHKNIRTWTLLSAACLILISLANVLHWGDYRYVFYCLFFLCALLLVDLSGRTGIEKYCEFASTLITIFLGGAILSFILARAGLPPLFTITNPDGQDYYFFYSGFTNSYSENFIRASAIYDEPGAFSMYICFIAALRHLLKQDKRTTWFILIAGFITFSLAHMIYVMLHFLAEQKNNRRTLIWLGLLIAALFVVVTTLALDSNIVLLSRLALSEDTNFFAGDNRSFQLFNAWDQISARPNSILFGLDNTCVFSQATCQQKFGFMGENPLSPLAFGGLSSELPYYLVILSFLASPFFGKRYLVLFGVGLLFLQRPYVMGFSYALIAVLLMDVSFRRRLGKKSTTPSSTMALE